MCKCIRADSYKGIFSHKHTHKVLNGEWENWKKNLPLSTTKVTSVKKHLFSSVFLSHWCVLFFVHTLRKRSIHFLQNKALRLLIVCFIQNILKYQQIFFFPFCFSFFLVFSSSINDIISLSLSLTFCNRQQSRVNDKQSQNVLLEIHLQLTSNCIALFYYLILRSTSSSSSTALDVFKLIKRKLFTNVSAT